jgi:HSP20 family protein
MDPFEPTRLRLRISDLDRQIDELFSSFVHWPQKGAIGAEEWKPAIDAYENDDAYLFVADLPGVKAEDLTVRVEADGIAICGTRTSAERMQSGRRLSVERRYGQFYRRFPLAQPVDADAIQVTQEQGVFYIRVPKRQRD